MDPMYQYSLEYFKMLFLNTIDSSPKPQVHFFSFNENLSLSVVSIHFRLSLCVSLGLLICS